MEKLVSLYVVSLKVSEPIADISEDLLYVGGKKTSRMTTGCLTHGQGDNYPTEFVDFNCLQWSLLYKIRKRVAVSDRII